MTNVSSTATSLTSKGSSCVYACAEHREESDREPALSKPSTIINDSMRKTTRSINACLPQLVQYLDVPSFTVYLIAEQLLTHEERDAVLSRRRRECQVVELLRTLKTKGSRWYERFMTALHKSASGPDPHLGHNHLLGVLPVAGELGGSLQRETTSRVETTPTRACVHCAMEMRASSADADTYASFGERSPVSPSSPNAANTNEASAPGSSSMLRKFEDVGQQCHALGALAAEVSRKMAAMEGDVMCLEEDKRSLSIEKEKMELKLRMMEAENLRLREESVQLREWRNAREKQFGRLREAIAEQSERVSANLILRSAEMEQVQTIMSDLKRKTGTTSDLKHLKIVVVTSLRGTSPEVGDIPLAFVQCSKSLDTILGRPQSVHRDNANATSELYYPDSNTKVSLTVLNTTRNSEHSKLTFVPDLVYIMLTDSTTLDSVPQLMKMMSAAMWGRCVVLVPNGAISIHLKRPFIQSLQLAGLPPHSLNGLPFVLLPSHDSVFLAQTAQEIAELFTVSLEKVSTEGKRLLLSLNVSRLSPAFSVDYSFLPLSEYDWPIGLSRAQADRCLEQWQLHRQKMCRLTARGLVVSTTDQLCTVVL